MNQSFRRVFDQLKSGLRKWIAVVGRLWRWFDQLEPGLRKWIAVVAGLLGIGIAATTFYARLSGGDHTCPGQRSGTLGMPIVDRGVTYAEFLERTGASPGTTDPATLKRVGNAIDLPITAVGYWGKRLPVRWSILTDRGKPLNVAELTDQLSLEVVPEDCSDSGRELMWTPLPSRPGHFLVEITLLDNDGERLDTRRTDVFAVLG